MIDQQSGCHWFAHPSTSSRKEHICQLPGANDQGGENVGLFCGGVTADAATSASSDDY
jgi:hypothetical protein